MLSYLSLFPDMLEDHFQDLTDEEVGILVRAAMRYAFDGVVPEFPARSVLGLTWRRLREHVDNTSKRTRTLQENGARGGRPKKPNETNEAALVSDDAQTENQQKPKCTEQGQGQEQGHEQEHTSADADAKRVRAARFTPPTIHEVMAYCQERGGKVNPQQWYAYYSANGWRVGRNPMRDWRAAVRTWENNGVNAPARAAPADYQRRSISPQGFSAMEVDLDAEVGT